MADPTDDHDQPVDWTSAKWPAPPAHPMVPTPEAVEKYGPWWWVLDADDELSVVMFDEDMRQFKDPYVGWRDSLPGGWLWQGPCLRPGEVVP